MTRQEEIIRGLERLRARKGPWRQSRDQKAPGALHRWWTELVASKPGLAETLKLGKLDREYICEQARRNKQSGYVIPKGG